MGDITIEEAAEQLVQFAPIITEVGDIVYLSDRAARRECIDEMISMSVSTSVDGHHYAILWDALGTTDVVTPCYGGGAFADIGEAASAGLADLAAAIALIDNAIATHVHNNLFGDSDVQS